MERKHKTNANAACVTTGKMKMRNNRLLKKAKETKKFQITKTMDGMLLLCVEIVIACLVVWQKSHKLSNFPDEAPKR